MKTHRRTAVILAAFAALLMAISGFAKSATVPSKAPTKHKRTGFSGKTASESNVNQTYAVRKGDTLTQIARAHQITLKELKALNGLKSSRIKAGQKLKVPAPQVAESPGHELAKEPKPAKPVEETISRPVVPSSDPNRILEEEQPKRLRLVEAGFQLIGVRYRFSGGSEKTGFDCSGLVKNLFSRFDIDLPRSSREQYKQGEKVDRDKLEVGDLVFFSSGGKTPTHVGIYIGDDKFLHAARKAKRVVVSDLNKIWYTMRYLGARRIADLWGEDAAPQSENE
jgi:cell wall-associated NlpC family hydrolase